jgi:hypothetical protein
MNLFWTVLLLVYCLSRYFDSERKYDARKAKYEDHKYFMVGTCVQLIFEVGTLLASTYLLIHLFKLLELI